MNRVAQSGQSFVNVFVLGFGFLEGLWIAVGTNPEAEIIGAVRTVVETLNPGSEIGFLFFLIPIIALIGTLVTIWFTGGPLGLGAVAVAFIAGLTIISFGVLGALLLIAAVVMGIFATS